MNTIASTHRLGTAPAPVLSAATTTGAAFGRLPRTALRSRRFTGAGMAAAIAAALMAPSPTQAAITFADDPVLFWNEVAFSSLVAPPASLGSPLYQTRGYAMVNIAMFDAVNSALGGPYRPYLTGVSGFGGNPQAAAIQAAYGVLSVLNPGDIADLDAARANSLSQILDGTDKDLGIATGGAFAAAILGARSADGSAGPGSYTTTGLPGDWRPTPPGGTAAAPFWGGVDPFVLESGDQFRPGPPPALDSAEYRDAYNEVKSVGSADAEALGNRTADQTASALFWDQANGQPWLRIGLTVAEDEGLSTIENAQVFALLTTGMADALIAGFDAKYEHRLWRPITAIREGNSDLNPETVGDAAWTSLFAAPQHPSYISTHSALSGVGSTILESFFGDDEAFTFTIAESTRSFDGLEDAALDGANSRLWGGIHFRFDNEAGLELGRQIGEHALESGTFTAPVPEPATWVMMIAGFGLIGWSMRRRRPAATAGERNLARA